jgi:hypothetical protein
LGGQSSRPQANQSRAPAFIQTQIAWSNVYHPLLFPHPAQAVLLDAILLGTAWLGTSRPTRVQSATELMALDECDQIPLQAINGATLFGGALVMNRLLVPALLAPWLALFVDPITADLATTPFRWLAIVALGAGGILLVIPALFYRFPLQKTYLKLLKRIFYLIVRSLDGVPRQSPS